MISETNESVKKALETLLVELDRDFSWLESTGYGLSSQIKWSDKSPRACIVNQEIVSLNFNGMGLTSIPLSITSANFPKLKGLNLRNNQFTELQLSEIALMKSLEILDLGKNSIAEIDLDEIKHLKDLKVLGLQENEIINLDLSPLKELQKLERIYLGGNLIDELDLEPLSQLLELVELDLSSNKMHRANFNHLHNLEKLYWLYLTDNNFSEETLKQTDQLKMNGVWVYV